MEHPLWADFQETLEIIREIRPEAEDGNEIYNQRLNILEDRVTDLSSQIATDLGIPDSRRGSPLWQDWEQKWRNLRKSQNEGRYEEEETLWAEIKELSQKLK